MMTKLSQSLPTKKLTFWEGETEETGTIAIHCLSTLCQVLSLVFPAIHLINTYCTMNWALRMEQRTNLAVEEKQLKIIAMTVHVP